MVRKNLLPNPSFKNPDLSQIAWEGFNGSTIAVVNEKGYYGDNYLAVTRPVSGNTGVHPISLVAVEALKPYAASAYVRVPATLPATPDATLTLRLTWRNSQGVTLREDTTQQLTISDSQDWSRLSGVFVAPFGSATVDFAVVLPTNGASGSVFLLDAALLEQSQYVGGYANEVSVQSQITILNSALSRSAPRVVNGLELFADIVLGDLVLNTIDEDGNLWICTDIEGWWVHSSPEVPDTPRGVEDGSFNVSGRYGTRQLTLKGVMIPGKIGNLSKARDHLIQATDLVATGEWLRTNEEPTRAAYVRLSGRPQIATVNSKGRTEFSIGLQAVDPIRYHWNDSDLNGATVVRLNGNSSGVVKNIGTAAVRGIFEITGPVGAGSTIKNYFTDQTIRLTSRLRGNNPIAGVRASEIFNNVATLTTVDPHELLVGDIITVFGVGSAFDSASTAYEVIAVSNEFPYTISYNRVWPDVPRALSSGSIALANRDVLRIDTYERSVTLNGNVIGFRSRVDTLVDWIKFTPGDNPIEFVDNIEDVEVESKKISGGKVTLTSRKAHFFIPGENVTVALPVDAVPVRKSLTSNVVTLVTDKKHGFSVGDKIDVVSTESLDITAKSRASNVATLTTAVQGDFNVNDTIEVSLPVRTNIIEKAVTSNVVSLRTSAPHFYGVGDVISVALPTTTNVVSKAVSSNVVTLTTNTAHNYAYGDRVTVSLPTSATVVAKARSGDTVTLTTNAAHGFSTGDQVQLAFPTQATITQTVYSNAASSITLTTSTAHGFSSGDRVTVDIGEPYSFTVTNKSATTSVATLTVSPDAANNIAVGEFVTVTLGDSSFDGNYRVSAVSGSTFSYSKANSSAVASTAATGTVINNTVQNGYNGVKVLDSVTSTTMTFSYYENFTMLPGTITRSSAALGSTPRVTSNTNLALNGTFPVSVVSANQFSYRVGA